MTGQGASPSYAMTPSSGGRGRPEDRHASSSSNLDAGQRKGPTVGASGPWRRRAWPASGAAMGRWPGSVAGLGGGAGGTRLASSNNRSTAVASVPVTLYLRKSEVSFRPSAPNRGDHAVLPTGG